MKIKRKKLSSFKNSENIKEIDKYYQTRFKLYLFTSFITHNALGTYIRVLEGTCWCYVVKRGGGNWRRATTILPHSNPGRRGDKPVRYPLRYPVPQRNQNLCHVMQYHVMSCDAPCSGVWLSFHNAFLN